MIRCDQCDNEVIAGWHFCPYCGHPLTDEEIEAAQRELTARRQAQETIYRLSRQVAEQPRGDFRWLIEAPGTRYLAVQSLTSSHACEWTTDHNRALAFRSKEQADAMLCALRQLDRQIETYENGGKLCWGKLFAFEPTLGNARAVEHGFI